MNQDTDKFRLIQRRCIDVPPIVANMLIIPFVLRYTYDVPLPIPLLMVTIGIGETISCGFLGLLLYKVLYEHKNDIFKGD